jgi:hypothetical protein
MPAAGAAGAAPARGAAVACKAVYFLGARGSGESALPQPNAPDFHGMGPEVDKMATVVQGVLKAGNVSSFQTLSVGYAADPVDDLMPTKAEIAAFLVAFGPAALHYYDSNVKKYLGSISDGVTSAVDEAKYVNARCPKAQLILAGYSQGAMVMHQAELRLVAQGDGDVLDHIAGTLLLGDGDRIPHTAAREFGTSAGTAEGVRTWLRFNSKKDIPEGAGTANICNAGDIVCDMSLHTIENAGHGVSVHTSYAVPHHNGSAITYTYSSLLTDAATWIGKLAERRLHATVTGWANVAYPLPAGGTAGNGDLVIACASASACTAAGSYIGSSGVQGMMLSGSGKSWTATTTPVPLDSFSPPAPVVTSIACPSVAMCAAAGYSYDSKGNQRGLLLTGSRGSWTPTVAPLPAGATTTPSTWLWMNAVACPSASRCVAAGAFQTATGLVPLLFDWTGSSWTVVKAPLPSNAATAHPNADILALACPSVAKCVAVGTYQNTSGGTAPMVLTGAATSWTAARLPVPPKVAGSEVVNNFAVACPSTARCIAVGNYTTRVAGTAVVFTMAGSVWTAAVAPDPGGVSGSFLWSVACPSVSVCVAVGEYSTSRAFLLTMAGSAWTARSAPLPANAESAGTSELAAVACPTVSACVAVGGYYNPAGEYLGLLVTGSGDTWAAGEAPLPSKAIIPNQSAALSSVVCPSASECMAAGSYDTTSSVSEWLVTGPS